ncbi:MAG: hypothetical protein KA175_10810 [Flavobacteriales bacterium]|nr:hypothetical protein [Flavobacteriales bacterium]MBP6698100.1 hypothetical protein [Flavobacteriales bacterium]
MNRSRITPDQLRALADKHAFPSAVIERVFDRMALDHTNPVAGTDLILRQAREQKRDPVDLAMGRPTEGEQFADDEAR